MDGTVRSIVMAIFSHIPHILMVAFGFVLYVSKGDERPRAARLLLIALCLQVVSIFAVPIGYQVLFQVWQKPEPGLMPFVGMVFSLPSVLGYGLLIYAAMLRDDIPSRRYRRDEMDDDLEYEDR